MLATFTATIVAFIRRAAYSSQTMATLPPDFEHCSVPILLGFLIEGWLVSGEYGWAGAERDKAGVKKKESNDGHSSTYAQDGWCCDFPDPAGIISVDAMQTFRIKVTVFQIRRFGVNRNKLRYGFVIASTWSLIVTTSSSTYNILRLFNYRSTSSYRTQCLLVLYTMDVYKHTSNIMKTWNAPFLNSLRDFIFY